MVGDAGNSMCTVRPLSFSSNAFSPMVLFFSMVDCRMSFPPIQLQDHPTKALGKDMGQTIQSRDSLCEVVLSIFDLLGQSRRCNGIICF